MIFKNSQHKSFYEESLSKIEPNNDVYYKALFYTLGLTAETRQNITDIYNFQEKEIIFEGVNKGWQTGTSQRVTRLAFNLFNNYHGEENMNDNPRYYTPEDIFCDSLMVYFFEAVKLRYPEYYHEV